jgi:hypothetical protein
MIAVRVAVSKPYARRPRAPGQVRGPRRLKPEQTLPITPFVAQSEAIAGWDSPRDHAPGIAVKCRKCGKVDSTLRASAFVYTLSAVVITLRRPASSGIFCSSCRRKEGIKWSLLTSLLGWWGIPWGPIFSVQSISRNLRGGAQGVEANAALLKSTGQTLADRGETTEAIQALEQSARLRNDPEVARLLSRVRGY